MQLNQEQAEGAATWASPWWLTCPYSGEIRYIKWFDKTHVQFYGGRSVRRKDVKMFYGEAAEQYLRCVENG